MPALSDASVQVRLLGPPEVIRRGVPVALPRSRKVRGLLAFLALNPHPLSRSRLCDLLWDVPNDPRGELRWCLSKLRGLLDEPDRKRVVTAADLVSLDLSDCHVDAPEAEAVTAAVDAGDFRRLAGLVDLFRGDLLEGVEIDGNPEFAGWLTAQRNRFRTLHIAALDALATHSSRTDDTSRWLEVWLQRAPFDARAHERMLATLVKAGRIREAEAHLAATIRSFEAEGVDWAPLRQSWQASRAAGVVQVEAPPPPPIVAPERSRRRASVAVMPFADRISGGGRGRVGDGLTEDIIMQLAKLRVLFVIGRGSVFALAERGIGAEEAGRLLNVDYVASGSVRGEAGKHLVVTVELADAHDGRIVWTDSLEGTADETFSVLDQIVTRIVAAIAEEIELAEVQRAILKPPSSLDAWESYHRGLWHMYRFKSADNQQASDFFRAALKQDPTSRTRFWA
jgi:DNA-binding SARP family transcriptional activator